MLWSHVSYSCTSQDYDPRIYIKLLEKLVSNFTQDFGMVAKEVLQGLEYRFPFNYRDNSAEEIRWQDDGEELPHTL